MLVLYGRPTYEARFTGTADRWPREDRERVTPSAVLSLVSNPAFPRVAAIGIYLIDILGRPVDAIPQGQNTTISTEVRLTVAGTAVYRCRPCQAGNECQSPTEP